MVGGPASANVEGFEWTDGPGGNIEHLARHGVSPADVHEVRDNDPLFFDNLPGAWRVATIVMVGQNLRHQSLIVFLIATANPGIWKPVTARRDRKCACDSAALWEAPVNKTEYDNLVRDADAFLDSEDPLRGARRISPSVTRGRDVFSLRLDASELEEIMAAAHATGVTTSEFIRSASLNAARAGSLGLPQPVLDAVHQLVRTVEAAEKGKRRRRSAAAP
ncbi:MAG TPA: hypothetical protein VH951_06025 [Dehalococcoidia bacterium]